MIPFKNTLIACLFGALGLFLGVGCSPSPPPETTRSSLTAASNAEPQLLPATSPDAEAAYRASLPQVGGPTNYVGSGECRACHEDQFNSWHRTYHRTMTQLPSPESIQARFDQVVLTNAETRFRLSQRSNEFWVRLERDAAGPNGEEGTAFMDTRIGLVTGSHHMQVFWLPGGQGNSQVGFPFTWLIPEQRWVPRNSTFIRPPDLAHRSEFWNVVCSRCHATGPEPRVDTATRTMATRVGELGISCEACHGPGERHVAARREQKHREPQVKPSAEMLRAEIVHPEKIDPARTSQICGFCHSMKWIEQSEEWRKHGFRYRPGDDLEKTTPIIRPATVETIPGLARYLASNPEILEDFFWPDGMIRVSGREFNGLIDSPCAKAQTFSCLSCHSLHSSEPDDLLSRVGQSRAACTQCHEHFRDETVWTAHTRHRSGSSGSECYNCHMPHTTYGVLKAIRSHQVSSPKVQDDLTTGRPNACNLCHLDKTLAWTAQHLAAWPGTANRAAATSSESTHGTVAEAVRLALSGDAGQRALLAWHFGWGPALATSGSSWVVPVLAHLLDDPYAAVRCVAERSLRAVAPQMLPSDYDFTVGPETRNRVRDGVIERWHGRSQPSAAKETLLDGTVEAIRTRLDEAASRRDDRPVRLRE